MDSIYIESERLYLASVKIITEKCAVCGQEKDYRAMTCMVRTVRSKVYVENYCSKCMSNKKRVGTPYIITQPNVTKSYDYEKCPVCGGPFPYQEIKIKVNTEEYRAVGIRYCDDCYKKEFPEKGETNLERGRELEEGKTELMEKFIYLTLPSILSNVPAKDRDRLTLAFYSQVEKILSNAVENAIKQPDVLSENIMALLADKEREKWQTMSVAQKKTVLLNDEIFKEIQDLSMRAYQKAIQRYEENILAKEKECYLIIKTLEHLVTKVRLYNILEASKLYSETIADLHYACAITDKVSCRIKQITQVG